MNGDWTERLHDIQEPPVPVAPSTSLLMLSLMLVGLSLALLAWRWWAPRRAGVRWWRASIQATAGLPPDAAIEALAHLLRQRMLQRDGPSTLALSGPAWCEALDQAFSTDFFTRGAGRRFGVALYLPQLPDEHELHSLREGLCRVLVRGPGLL